MFILQFIPDPEW